MGAQFGTVNVPPVQPPAVVGEQKVETGRAPGGAGAATDQPVTEPTRVGYEPLSSTPPARSSATATAATTEPDEAPTTEPTVSVEPTPSAEPTTPPTEDTTEPTDPPSDDGGGADPTASVPPDPDDPIGEPVTVTLAGR